MTSPCLHDPFPVMAACQGCRFSSSGRHVLLTKSLYEQQSREHARISRFSASHAAHGVTVPPCVPLYCLCDAQISRWPYRKVQSIESVLSAQVAAGAPQEVLDMLKRQMQAVYDNPEVRR